VNTRRDCDDSEDDAIDGMYNDDGLHRLDDELAVNPPPPAADNDPPDVFELGAVLSSLPPVSGDLFRRHAGLTCVLELAGDTPQDRRTAILPFCTASSSKKQ